MRVYTLDHSDERCDEYVTHIPRSTLYHGYTWAHMIERHFGYRSYYLVAARGHDIHGVLPLTYVRSRLFGDRLVSQAFSNYCGPLTDSPEALHELTARAVDIAGELGGAVIELRDTESMEGHFLERLDKVTLRIALPSDSETLWASFKSGSKVRNHVRKAEEYGLSLAVGRDELLSEFYRIWTRRMWELGTPCYPISLFRCILETFPKNCQIFVARNGQEAVGARFVIRSNDLVESRWGASRTECDYMRVNHFLYWHVMKHYCERSAKWFDFGRSTVDSSQHKYKEQWGAKSIQLHYHYWFPPGRTSFYISPQSNEYRRKAAIWRRLPLGLTRLLGPHIGRYLV